MESHSLLIGTEKSASIRVSASQLGTRLESDSVVHGVSQPLLASEIAFCRLDAHVPEQKLNLLEFAAGLMAQSGARATEIVRGNSGQVARHAGVFHNAPDHLGAEPGRSNSPGLVDATKNWTGCDVCVPDPRGQCYSTHAGTGTVLT
jgi:hypothetical protein